MSSMAMHVIQRFTWYSVKERTSFTSDTWYVRIP